MRSPKDKNLPCFAKTHHAKNFKSSTQSQHSTFRTIDNHLYLSRSTSSTDTPNRYSKSLEDKLRSIVPHPCIFNSRIPVRSFDEPSLDNEDEKQCNGRSEPETLKTPAKTEACAEGDRHSDLLNIVRGKYLIEQSSGMKKTYSVVCEQINITTNLLPS